MSTLKSIPKLPDAPSVKLFRAVEGVLRRDRVLGATVATWRTCDGTPADRTPLNVGHAPAVRLWPLPEPEGFYSPDAMTGWVSIVVDLLVKGSCTDDVGNLWWALEKALYPPDQASRLAVHQVLRAAGAHTGEAQFQPASDRREDAGADGQLRARGVIRIEYRNQFS